MKTRGAFTLVELVLVVSLTAIVAAMAAGGLKGVNSWRGSNAVRRVASDLTFARDRALLTGCRTLWVFDMKKQSYDLLAEAAPASGAISATLIQQPNGADWRVNLNDLAAGLKIKKLAGTSKGAVGFAANGALVAKTGKPVNSAKLTFNNGAVLSLAGATGTATPSWP